MYFDFGRFFLARLVFCTGKSLSEAPFLQNMGSSFFAEHGFEHVVYKNCSECQKQFLLTTCSLQVRAWNFHVLNL